MNKNISKFLLGCCLALSGLVAKAQGLEGIIVEEYHTVTQADADFYNLDLGNGSYPLVAGMKVYRVYADLAPNYRMIQIYGDPIPQGGSSTLNPLDITTTTTFWNDDNFGGETPGQTRRLDEGTMFDSYLTINTTGIAGGAVGCGSALQQFGVPRADDTDGDLTSCSVYPGFTGNDGNIPGTGPTLTYNIGGTADLSAFTANASSFSVVNEGWATVPPMQGVDPAGTNRVLIFQVTTNGDLSFHLCMDISDPNQNLERYVWNEAQDPGQQVSPFLTYPASTAPDCLGVPGGLAIPGSPCDDGQATTGNDTWDANCNCVGELIDCEGTIGGFALPGTGCDDNDPLTGNDSFDANCNCVGQPIDCLGVAGGSALPGTSCDDGNASTINDVYDASCTCAGTPLPDDCVGVPGGSALPGTACDDGDPLTGNDVYDANCTCAGQVIDCLGVAGGAALPGTTCDDGNASTINDVYDASCNCAGTPLPDDCLGVPGGSALPGTTCDDGNASTINDVYDANCTCAGTPLTVDCLGVPGGSALPGTACDDGDASTTNDVYDANCTCAGTPLPEDCLGVPGGSALPGTACDDQNPNTINDTWGSNCVCSGTPIGGCTNDLAFDVQTDGNGAQITWEVRDESGANVVASGGPFPSNVFLTDDICLADGCYTFRVLDAGGDGIVGGGYVLRTLAGERIIDNTDNGGFGSISAISGNQGFCLPLGTDGLIYTSCDKIWWKSGEYIVANPTASVSAIWVNGGANNVQSSTTGYEFWFYNPNGGYSFRKFRSHNISDGFANIGPNRTAHLKINNWAASSHVPDGVLLNVRIRSRVLGTNAEWGPACRFMRNEALAACPPTKLMDIPTNVNLSCGQFRQFVGGQRVYARPVGGATQYQWRFRLPAEGVEIVLTTSTYILNFPWDASVAAPLEAGKTYEVEVRAFKNGAWCGTSDPWGDICNLTITGTPAQGGSQNLVLINNGGLSIWPNPNSGDQFWISLDEVAEDVMTVSVDIMDLTGKRVIAREIPVTDRNLNTVFELNGDLATGMYLVNITAGEKRWTERLVIAD